MLTGYVVSGFIALLATLYLLVALIMPERF
jgi:hypothetical protein